MPIAYNGEAKCAIVVAEDASPSQQHAADELASFLSQVTGAAFKPTHQAPVDMPRLLVGRGAARQADPDFSVADLGMDGIIIRTAGKDLILAGHEPRGTLYAVYTFLEEQVGCHWWSSTASTIPRRAKLVVGKLDISYTPQFEYREITYFDALDGDYAVRNKLNGHQHHLFVDDGLHNARENRKLGGRRYAFHKSDKWAHHSFYTLIAPEVYFQEHPEWFAEVPVGVAYGTGFDGFANFGGKTERAESMEQCKSEWRSLCLTNEAMRRELVRNSRIAINWSPVATMFAVSQIDGMNPCRCDRCMAVIAEEEAYSGLMIRFVNHVAEDLSKFTHMPIITLAYHYTRKPPKYVRPRDNVIVSLVVAYDDIPQSPVDPSRVSHSKPLTHPRNHLMHEHLMGWSRICDRLYIYDYAPSFSCALMPYPNLYVRGPNMRLYAEAGVTGVSSEGYSRVPGTALAELRAWLFAKLAWNPNQDDRQLIETFANGYYRPAGKHILAYIETVHDAVDQTDEWLGQGSGYNAEYLSFNTLSQAWRHLQAAEQAVGNDAELRSRVEVAKLPAMYVIMMNWDRFRSQAAANKADWPFPESIDVIMRDFLRIGRAKGITTVDQLPMMQAMTAARDRIDAAE